MKRTALYISSALLLIVGLCLSCQKEQNFSEGNGAPVNEVIVKATIGSADTKVSFTKDGSTLKTAWENDDHIVGWDKDGNAIELEIASIDNGTAIFKLVEGSSAIPSSGKVYMIYAPGKNKSNISNKSLEYSLSDQGSGKLPALMTATGEVSGNVLSLTFANQLAIVAVKNPTFPVTAATAIIGLKLSGSNIQTKATFSMDEETLKMEPSEEGDIARGCSFTTEADGTTTETMVYFAVLPNSTAADVTVSTTSPTGYQISFQGKSFAAGQCYLLNQKTIDKQTFTVTVAEGITGGTITTNPSSSVAWGTEVTVTAAPNEGYELATLTYNDGTDRDIKAAGTFTMPQKDVTVSGTFQLSTFNITATAVTEGGSYTVQSGSPLADVTTAKMGDVITVTPSPADGYSGGTVTVKKTGTEETVTFDDTNKTFEMPASGVTITVTFKESLTGAINGHNYVKIGSKKWATTNLGATNPQDYGEYFQWGETAGHKCNGTTSDSAFESSYCFDWSTNPFNGGCFFYDETAFNKSTYLTGDNLKSDYDAAFKATGWGSSWHMPTKEDFADLADNGVWIWTTDYNSTGKSGYIVYVAQHDDDKGKAKMNGTLKKWNGSSYVAESVALKGSYSESSVDHIFFPAAGQGSNERLDAPGSFGGYWSSTLSSFDPYYAYSLSFIDSSVNPQNDSERYYGFSVRPVSD